MRITGLETLRSPIQPNVCLLRLHSSDGLTGLGESFWGAAAVEAYLHETVGPVLLGIEDPAPERVAVLLRPYVGFGGSGAETRGNGAVDIALWDLLGRRAGLPVAALLGGPVRPRVRVYNTCAGYEYVKNEPRLASTNFGLPAGPAEPAGPAGPAEPAGLAGRPYEDLDAFLNRPAELTRSLLAEGFTAMKVWPFDHAAEESGGLDIPAADLGRGMRVLEQIRASAGDAMDILVELHGLWSLKAATTILDALRDVRPYWVEDPLRPDSVAAYQRLRERTAVPIATGETLTGRRAFQPLLDAGALDVAIVDAGWTGGITEARKIAALADAYDVPFAPHDCTGPVSFAVCTQLVASQPNGLIAETVRAFHHSWYAALVDGLPAPADGAVEVGTGPGLGIALRPEFVNRADTVRRLSRR
jgi:L-alanine-DL-glutamate epimerase-like enolase superfamily enzyme